MRFRLSTLFVWTTGVALVLTAIRCDAFLVLLALPGSALLGIAMQLLLGIGGEGREKVMSDE